MLARLEQIGKSFGWITQFLTALGAGIIAFFAYKVNQNLYDFQQKTLALQTVRDFTVDARNPDQKYGTACAKFLLHLTDADLKVWWKERKPTILLRYLNDAGGCLPDSYAQVRQPNSGFGWSLASLAVLPDESEDTAAKFTADIPPYPVEAGSAPLI